MFPCVLTLTVASTLSDSSGFNRRMGTSCEPGWAGTAPRSEWPVGLCLPSTPSAVGSDGGSGGHCCERGVHAERLAGKALNSEGCGTAGPEGPPLALGARPMFLCTLTRGQADLGQALSHAKVSRAQVVS